MQRKDIPKIKKMFIENFINSFGNISVACEKTGISRNVFYEWQKKDKKFAEEVEKAKELAREKGIDFAENKLMALINEKHFGAIVFYLCNVGKIKGWSSIQRVDISGKVEIPKPIIIEPAKFEKEGKDEQQ